MKFALFGSRIIDDAVIRINNSGHNDVNRIVGISPFTLNCSFTESNIINQSEIAEKNAYRKKITLWDVNKNILGQLKNSKCSYVCLDMWCAINPIWECMLEDGRVFRVTLTDTVKTGKEVIKKAIEAFAGTRIIKEQEINPLSWTDSKIESEITAFADSFTKAIGNKQPVFLDVKRAFQYEQDGEIVNDNDYRHISMLNGFVDKCSSIFLQKVKCTLIPSSDFILGGEMYKTFDGLYYSEEYYEYIDKCLRTIEKNGGFSGGEENTLLKEYEDKLQDKVDLMMLPETFKSMEASIKGKKIILIGGSKKYAERLESEYKQKVAFSIPYDSACAEGKMCSELAAVLENKDEYLCLITHLKQNDDMLEILWDNGSGFCPLNACFYSSHKPVNLENFKGRYFDVFHNSVLSYSEGTKIMACGLASSVELDVSSQKVFEVILAVWNQNSLKIGKNFRSAKMKMILNDGSKCSIGDNCSFAENCIFAFCNFGSTSVGNDCMFSNGIVVHAGDGHAIFDTSSERRINYNKIEAPSKFEIKLDDHIWVGYEAFILAGTHIGTGCILGGRSLANKKYPNNCILAGNPARVIKEDVAWTRDPFTQNILETDVLDSAYMQMTER